MKTNCTRRKFLTSSLLGAAAAGVAGGPAGALAQGAPAPVPAGAGSLPKGKLGTLELSRLILGTNIITHHVHSRHLNFVNNLERKYNTDEKVQETFALAQAHGVNTFMTHHDQKVMVLFREFRDHRGGKMNWLVAPDPSECRKEADFKRSVEELVNLGVDALYLHGATSDPLVQKGNVAQVAKLVDIMKATGLPVGVAAHDLKTVQACAAAKMPVDYWVKTFHHLNYPTAPRPEEIKGPTEEVPHGYWCSNPAETAAFMQTLPQPWIAYKVMAAGAIPPRDAFDYSYRNGADFILAGMFDFEIAEDAEITRDVLERLGKRERPWRG
jgi:hypothetical protein